MNEENNSEPINRPVAPKGAATQVDENQVSVPSPVTPIMPDMDFFSETDGSSAFAAFDEPAVANQPPSLAAHRLEDAVAETNKHLSVIRKMLAVFQYLLAFAAVAAILYIAKNVRPKVA